MVPIAMVLTLAHARCRQQFSLINLGERTRILLPNDSNVDLRRRDAFAKRYVRVHWRPSFGQDVLHGNVRNGQ